MKLLVLAVLLALVPAPAFALDGARPAMCTDRAEPGFKLRKERKGDGVALLQGGDYPIYEIYGDITEKTYTKLTKLIGNRKGGWLFLRSPGGQTYWSIMIGDMIRRQEICTYVPDKWMCASGCAIVWAGGVQRWIAKGWKIGFHRTMIIRDGKEIYDSADVDYWNTLVENYYWRMGYSTEAIKKFQAPATSIYWLTQRDAERLDVGANYLWWR